MNGVKQEVKGKIDVRGFGIKIGIPGGKLVCPDQLVLKTLTTSTCTVWLDNGSGHSTGVFT